MTVVRRRSRRRKGSYPDQPGDPGPDLRLEDLSPRAKRLVESGVIDVSTVAGSGERGRITSGDILERARLMEKEQSVARIEAIDGRRSGEATSGRGLSVPSEPTVDTPPFLEYLPAFPEPAPYEQKVAEPPGADTPEEPEMPTPPLELQTQLDPQTQLGPQTQGLDEPVVPATPVVSDLEATSTWSVEVAGHPIEVPPSPWDAYNGSTEGLAEGALPGAERSWGEAQANIAAIAEEAAAQLHGWAIPTLPADPGEPVLSAGEPLAAGAMADRSAAVSLEGSGVVETASEVRAAAEQPAPVENADDNEQPEERPESDAEVMMDFGTLELVDPASVWAEGAEDFAPWFLANSKQLGDVLGLEAGLSDTRQYTTKSATGVLGRDDHGEQVVVVASQQAEADDSDLGRALGMAASSGAATVALVSARFGPEQLQALQWLNSQTKSGVKWFGIEMRVVRIADSPPAMMFTLVVSPPQN